MKMQDQGRFLDDVLWTLTYSRLNRTAKSRLNFLSGAFDTPKEMSLQDAAVYCICLNSYDTQTVITTQAILQDIGAFRCHKLHTLKSKIFCMYDIQADLVLVYHEIEKGEVLLNDEQSKSYWIPGLKSMKLYVRFLAPYKEYKFTVVISSIQIDNEKLRSRGYFTEFLDGVKRLCIQNNWTLRVESVVNHRLFNRLVKDGFVPQGGIEYNAQSVFYNE